MLALGLINGSFLPPKDLRELRELTRYRDKLISMRTSEKDRAHNILEVCNIKLASVATDIFGVSGMAMNALIEKQESSDPAEIAELAKGRLCEKIAELIKALQGRVDAHHAETLSMVLDHLAYLGQQIAKLEQRIEEKAKPYQQEIELLDTIPGIDKTSAQSIIAEIGTDMSVFETPERLASWAGLSPCQCALAASHTKDTYLASKYHGIKGRRGPQKAIIAMARHQIVSIFFMIKNKEPYRELGGDYLLKLRPKNIANRMIKRLQSLGYEVTKKVS